MKIFVERGVKTQRKKKKPDTGIMWFNCAKKSNIYQGKKINRKADGEKI